MKRSVESVLDKSIAQTTEFLPSAHTTDPGASTSTQQIKLQQQENETTGYFVSSLVAGVGSGAISSVICAPLDILRTRMQVWGDVATQKESTLFFLKSIAQRDGWKGYFRGLGATLATVPLFWGLYFPLYDKFKLVLGRERPQWNQSLVHCTAAISAGAVADLVCNPFFVIRTRLQTEALHNLKGPPMGILETSRALYAEGGMPIFWRGLTASLFGLSHVAMQFPLYEHFKGLARERRHDRRETTMDLLLSSGCSKMCASAATYPHEVIRSRMMDSRSAQEARFRPTILRVWQQEGLAGFYSGLQITLIRVLPNCVITFTLYELLLRWSKDNLLKTTKG